MKDNIYKILFYICIPIIGTFFGLFFGIVSQSFAVNSVSYLGNAVNGNNTDIYTFSMSFGSESTDRYLISVVSCTLGSSIIGSVKIGGITATEVSSLTNGSVSSKIHIAAVPTGTSGNVVISSGAAMYGCGVALYRATGLNSATAYDNKTSTASPGSVTIGIAHPGFVIAGTSAGAANFTTTWSGTSNDYDANIDTFQPLHFSGGYAQISSPTTVTATRTNNTSPVMVSASWQYTYTASTRSRFIGFGIQR